MIAQSPLLAIWLSRPATPSARHSAASASTGTASARACASMPAAAKRGDRSRRRNARGAQIIGSASCAFAQRPGEGSARNPSSSTPSSAKRGANRQRKTVECTLGGGENAEGGSVNSCSAGPYICTVTESRPIIPRARRSRHALRNFALHHQHGHIQRRVAGRQLEQNRRGDVIRQVAHHAQPLSGLGCRRRKIELQYILLDDGHALRIELPAQSRGKLAIELNRHHAPGPRRQRSGDARRGRGQSPPPCARQDRPARATMRSTACASTRKFCPSLGLLRHLLRW